MKDYIQVIFSSLQPEQMEILVARLADADYEGFEETADNLCAYISSENFDEEVLSEIAYKYQLHYAKTIIPATNWNEVWESGFQPVSVGNFCTIRAEFHKPLKNPEYEIIITPKQSFGTGHHSTTYMMIQQMREMDFKNKLVLDFGTGTGILAILAEKLGAKKILALDIDDWSIENAAENIEKNSCKKISLIKSGSIPASETFDIILANINKNIIIDNLPAMKLQLNPGGVIVVSGLLEEDETEINEAIKRNSLKISCKLVKTNWLSLKLNH